MSKETRPLADKMRPEKLSDFVGQHHLMGKGKIISALLRQDKIPSLIFWGPPGSGKTTLAKVIAGETKSRFVFYSAVEVGVNEIKQEIKEAKEAISELGQKTIICIDEIHRWNKSQQAYLLPHVEDGTIVLIGATTENPSFEVIGPLLSRSKVLFLNQLEAVDIDRIVSRALKDKENGLGNLGVSIEKDALKLLLDSSNGDARVVLNALEIATNLTRILPAARLPDGQGKAGKNGKKIITKEKIEEALQSKLLYDKAGEEHYNVISAFIKSLRGSDPHAAVYYLARMLEAGEDPEFIARRMVILASEDVGNADPKANASYMSRRAAQQDVRKTLNEPVPMHIRNPVTKLMRNIGYGKGYKYAHDFPEGYTKQQFLPDRLKGRKYYNPKDIGYERYIKDHLEKLKSQ